MPKIPIIKSKDFHKYLLKYGCSDISVNGSHHKVYCHMTGNVSIVAVHAGKDFDRGSFSGVISQLGINIDDFIDFISFRLYRIANCC